MLDETGMAVGGGEWNPFPWSRLCVELPSWVSRRARAPLDAEDIASETVQRALVRLGPEPAMSWAALWTWSTRTAHHVLASAWRRLRRVEELVRPEELVWACIDADRESTPRLDLLEQLATPAQRRMLQLMRTGVTTTRDLAARLGCSVRVAESHRRGLREAWSRAGILPETIGPERFLG